MILSSTIVVSLLIGMQGVMAPSERQQYSRCLRAFVDSKLQERMAVPAFETAMADACSEQAAAYRTAYIAAATRAGDRRQRAEADANLEVQDLRTNFLELFRGAQPE